MIDIMDLSIKNKTMLLSNLSFDHPLLSHEINDLINMLSSGIAIGQIYFKDTIDIDSIEKIKLLLEGLPNIDDRKIEKYIMKSITSHEKEQLDKMSFQNIDTWNIAYSVENNRFAVTSLPKYRLIDDWFKNTVKEMDESLSPLEKVCYLYDKVKMFEFDSNSKYGRLPEIIKEGIANSYGYNFVFKELLNLCDISSFIESYEVDNEESYVTFAHIQDKKYRVDGVYFFDPSMDTILKEQYKNNLARRMNYNFFAMTREKFLNINGQVIPNGILKAILSNDELEYKHNLRKYTRKYGFGKVRELEKSFKDNIDNVFTLSVRDDNIPTNILFEIFDSRVDDFCKDREEKESITSTIVNNYNDREKELFNTKNVKSLSKLDLQIA